ncbi:NPCBM/NEW2 domain-containing protein [Prolixibacter bellariivorans]|nr:NPCBM/NEW2 domain-containing protein [Prolixibacter bellariivorans]
MKKIIFGFLSLLLPFFVQSKTIWLNELDVSRMYQDWGAPMVNRSILGTQLSVAGIKYKRGIGTHSISRFIVRLDGKAKFLSGQVGADDRNDFAGKMEFQILADQQIIWRSGLMQKGMPAKSFNITLKDIKKLAFLVTEGGDGIMYDHADWLNVRFETAGEVVPEAVMPEPLKNEKYILTPQPSPKPKINNAKVFGVRPGNPFLLTIAATGNRPMSFSVQNMPEGLELDTQTGIISGMLIKPGTYSMILQAKNELGTDARVVRVQVGDEIALTPPMGWNSWNCWGLKVDEQKVVDAASFMKEKLMNHGWSYINIDDGWEANKRSANGDLEGNEKFPDFKRLCDSIHEMGLKFGIYSSPGPRTCGGHLGSYGYEDMDARTWADWGVDYLKYDYCYYSEIAPVPTEELIKEPYIVMRDALDGVPRDIVYCVGFGAPNVWNWAREAGGNQWRTTRDITDEWNIVRSIGFFQDVCAPVTRPGKYNDPDMLVVGKLGMGWGANVHESYLTPDEQYSHISLWCILSSPLLIGCDMSDMDDFTLNLLTNDEVIGVDQDPAVMPAHKIMVDNGQIWYKYLEDGSIAVGFFHVDPYFILWNKEESETIQKKKYDMSLDFAFLNLSGKVVVRDLWRQKDLGTFENNFSTEVPYHGVTFVKLTPATN